jgi:hypothetical protein
MAQLPILATGYPTSKAGMQKNQTLARTDTTPKQLYVLPKFAVPAGFTIYSPTPSNAGTSANINIGIQLQMVSVSAAGTSATLTTAQAHGLTTADLIYITNTGQTNFNTTVPTAIVSVPSTTTLTYTISSTTATTTAGQAYGVSYYINNLNALASGPAFGTATLVAGTATVNTTFVTPGSKIFLTNIAINASTAIGVLTVGTIVSGTSFVINSRTAGAATVQAGDASTVAWSIQDLHYGSGLVTPTPQNNLFPTASGATSALTADTMVAAVYSETGTASTLGGPWVISAYYYMTGSGKI